MSKNFYIITGGPGSGKTTLLGLLKQRGFNCVDEGARHIIQLQMRAGGEALPWNNVTLYKEKLLAHALETYNLASQRPESITFFDRGIFDLLAYERRTKTEALPEIQKALKVLCYNKRVFVAPPWKEIFCNDRERRQTYEEAVEVYQVIIEVYKEFGFELIELPKTTVSDRADFLISICREPG